MADIKGAMITLLPSTVATTGTGTQVFSWGSGSFDTASLYVNVTTSSGPQTLDVYVQTSWNQGANWADFIHFGQVQTTSSSLQVAQWSRKATSNSATAAVIATGDANLAAGKVVNGPVWDNYMRVKYIVAGTSYTFSVFAAADRDA
jgi:hypothetical protein